MSSRDEIIARIERSEALVAVVGLGYVGLPLALTFVEHGLRVIGLDTDHSKLVSLREGRSYLEHIPAERVTNAAGLFVPTDDFGRLATADAVIVCVPTPLTAAGAPDLSFVVAACRAVRECLRPGQLVVLESTTYPGTTDELVRSILDETGLRCGEDYFLAFSPEREDPGNKLFTTSTIPKVVGGVDDGSGDVAVALYRHVIDKVVRVSSARVAEATKLTENSFRAVNIALVNELKLVFDRMGVDIWEVLAAAATKPFGFMRFDPGPGWGGHCIPVDPVYLAWKARESDVRATLVECAGEINRQTVLHVVQRTEAVLQRQGKELAGSSVLVLGVAYKAGVADTRESPALKVIDRLRRFGARVAYHDPFVPEVDGMRSVQLTAEELGRHDVVLLTTAHAEVDYELTSAHARAIVDTRGVFNHHHPKVTAA